MYNYIKALHIIFIVTWFSGLFYIVRLFIYNAEAEQKEEPQRMILHEQFMTMIRRLWLGITWPSAIMTLIFGPWMWILMGSFPRWLAVKMIFVVALYAYHMSLHIIYRQQSKKIYKYSSQQLRMWNEVSTVFLFAIVFVAVVKQAMGLIWGLGGLFVLIVLLFAAIRIYKKVRAGK